MLHVDYRLPSSGSRPPRQNDTVYPCSVGCPAYPLNRTGAPNNGWPTYPMPAKLLDGRHRRPGLALGASRSAISDRNVRFGSRLKTATASLGLGHGDVHQQQGSPIASLTWLSCGEQIRWKKPPAIP
jgi:hypothetical protein